MQKAWFALAVVAALAATWMGRYHAEWTNGGYLRLDRWNGDVTVCDGKRCVTLPR